MALVVPPPYGWLPGRDTEPYVSLDSLHIQPFACLRLLVCVHGSSVGASGGTPVRSLGDEPAHWLSGNPYNWLEGSYTALPFSKTILLLGFGGMLHKSSCLYCTTPTRNPPPAAPKGYHISESVSLQRASPKPRTLATTLAIRTMRVRP